MELNTYLELLGKIEEKIPILDTGTANQLLDDLFLIKPVRLKWFLLKAMVMIKENKAVDEITDFLSDKCEPCYQYEGVEEYLLFMSSLAHLKGDLLEEKRYKYLLDCLKIPAMDGTKPSQSGFLEFRKKLLGQTTLESDDMIELANYYYINGNPYLYLLWKEGAKKAAGIDEAEERQWILAKINAEYYYNRLISREKETFILFASSKADEEDCALAAKALQVLGKHVFVVKQPEQMESMTFQELVKKSISSINKKDGIGWVSSYVQDEQEEGGDTRADILQYLTEFFSDDGMVMVMGSGQLIDMLAMNQKLCKKMERLSQSEAEYMEDTMAVARYGDYLAYVAKIYHSSKEQLEKQLYKQASCRFSIIIPCRNAGDTLYYTLKTCLNQSFGGDYEIVVSDNSDVAMGADTPTRKICQELNDSRVKYYRAPGNLSLMKNFEYANLKAEGDFLISMGADDGIMPWALEELDGVLKRNPDRQVLLWQEAFYKWANVDSRLMVGGGMALLDADKYYQKGSPEISLYQSAELLKGSLSKYGYMYYLPQVYHNSGIRKGYLTTLYEKTGALWGGITQDISMAVIVGCLQQDIAMIENVLTITGISSASIGANARAGNTKLEQENLIKTFSSTYRQGWRIQGYFERLFPVTGTQFNCLYACMMYAYAIGVLPQQIVDVFDWKSMYTNVFKELNREDILFDVKFHKMKYALSLNGEELLSDFESANFFQLLLPTKMHIQQNTEVTHENGYQENIIISNQKKEAPPFSISDVYKVSLYLEKELMQCHLDK